MPKHYKDMIDELINKMDEDAPANAVAHGGVDMNPTGKKVKKKDDAEDVLRLSLIHISEPTRQAEISYAVFCLKKKKLS